MRYKFEQLQLILKGIKSCVIAFSGGVDSTLLLKAAADVLGKGKVLAVTMLSFRYPAEESENAKKIASVLGLKQVLIESEDMNMENFFRNSPERCYFCKYELFSKLLRVAEENGLNYVCDGSNMDDTGDYRPGITAARELKVRSPLMEAGLSKHEIRKLSRKLALPTWDKPAAACLATRFPYGEKITQQKLKLVEEAEKYLRLLGCGQLRVRYHQGVARIELLPADFPIILISKEQVVNKFKELGFDYIALDLEGFRSGSMNDVIGRETGNEQT